MHNNYIAVIDSGVGGLSVLSELIKLMPNERFLYFGDNDNAPYGEKSKRELLSITLNNLTYLKSFGLKALVLGCNTLSTSLLEEIKNFIKIPVFPVFPPFLPLSKGERALLMGTPLTIKNYLQTYGVINGLETLPLEALALDIEQSNVQKITEQITNIKGDFQVVILGCTHYFFIKNQIFNHLKPLKIISGNNFCALNVKKFFNNTKSLDKIYQKQILFVGKNKEKNKRFWENCGRYI